MQFIQKFLDGADLLIAGTLGALVSLAAHTELQTAKQRLYYIVCGAVSAYYLSDSVAGYFNLQNAKAISAIGFLIGIFGAALLQAIMRGIKDADLWGFIKARFGVKGEPNDPQ